MQNKGKAYERVMCLPRFEVACLRELHFRRKRRSPAFTSDFSDVGNLRAEVHGSGKKATYNNKILLTKTKIDLQKQSFIYKARPQKVRNSCQKAHGMEPCDKQANLQQQHFIYKNTIFLTTRFSVFFPPTGTPGSGRPLTVSDRGRSVAISVRTNQWAWAFLMHAG